ncbi:MAG: Na/Pi cotransporter family protein [Solobacterium sp.]|nr:Na/Pi cotransporter family protein [Solobacterium sp.]
MSITSLNWGMILGGFGLFMFGIKFMGDGMKAAAGDKLRDIINRYTSNRFMALLVGIVLTIIMQSSSATSAITIGLVRANLMTLEQAVGVILGATIGTTVTSFLISVNVDKYALYIAFVGCMLICFAKKRKTVYIGNVILGFGLIFFGMGAMGDGLAQLKELPQFEAFALKMSDNPLLAFITGIGLTGLVQSSAATIGVAQKLYNAGAITFAASLPFMFGANIGTTVTGILASLGGSSSGKRTAATHTTINLISAAVGMILLKPYSAFVQSFAGGLNPMMQIAVANMVFKTITTCLFLPFVTPLVAFIKKIVPGEETVEIDVEELDEGITQVLPGAALQASSMAIMKLLDMVRLNISMLNDSIGGGLAKDKADQNETVINRLDQKITTYLIELSTKPNLNPDDTENVRKQLDAVKNLERIGDLAINVAEFFEMTQDEGKNAFSSEAIEEMKNMMAKLIDMYDIMAEVFVTREESLYHKLLGLESELDGMEAAYRRTHFDRMRDGVCKSPIAESVYCDILGTIEIMGDHCCNVCKSTVTGMTSDLSDDEVIA